MVWACTASRVIIDDAVDLMEKRVPQIGRPTMSARTYTVYILTNRYRTVFYIGMTNDLARGLREHRSGRGSVFTALYRVTDLVCAKIYPTSRDAIRREKQLKGWRREKKPASSA